MSNEGYADDTVRIMHHYYHPSPPTVSVKAERNSRGVNWEASVSGVGSVAEAMKILDEARTELEHRFGAASEAH